MKAKSLLIALSTFLVFTGCSGNPSGDQPSSSKPTASSDTKSTSPAKDSLIVAQDTDAGTMDPQKQGKIPDMSILSNMFDTLVTRDADNKLAPGLATEWKTLNETTWQFKLRQGVKFQNGEPFDANAVKFSIERLLNPATKSPIVELNTVKSVEIVDPYTVNFVTSAPDPILPNKTTLFGGVIVPPKYIQEKGDDNFAKNPIGTGPYKFVSWQKDNRVEMEANPDYWRGAPKFKKLTFRIIPNPADMVAALKTGEIDIAASLSADVADQLKNESSVQVNSNPWIRTFYISLDTTQDGPLAKKEVRQALNYAIDVDTMIKTVLGGHAARVSTLIPKQNFGIDTSIKPYEYNPDKAKQLLAQAGYPQGFSISLDATNADSNNVQAIAGQLAKVGVNVKINLMDSATLVGNITAKKASPLYYIGNTGWTMDALSNFQSYIKSDRRYNRWKNAEADKLIDTEEQSVDPKVRQEAFTKLQVLLKEEAPFIYLYQLDGIYGMRKNIQWTPSPTGVLNMYGASIK